MKNLVLVVEDRDEDFEAFCRVVGELQVDSSFRRICDGEEALDYLYHRGAYQDSLTAPRPSLILMDLNLPGTDGRDVIREVKQDNHLKNIPIVVFSTSSSPQDREICYHYGANSYLIKPMGLANLKKTIAIFCQYWLHTSILPSVVD